MKLQGQIQNFMTVFPNTVDASASLQTALKMMKRYDFRHLPVLENGKLLGVANERDVATAVKLKGVDGETESVRSFAIPAHIQVEPTAEVRTVIEEMVRRKEELAVVFKAEKLVGIFTVHDALNGFLKEPT